MRRTNAQALATRSRLIGSAIDAFVQEGIDAASIEGIAARAGVTRGAVYWHFADKSAIFEAALMQLRWPVDTSRDLIDYRHHDCPLSLLCYELATQIECCINNPTQRKLIHLALGGNLQRGKQADTLQSFRQTQLTGAANLEKVMAIAATRGDFRTGVTPKIAAHLIYTSALGILLVTTKADRVAKINVRKLVEAWPLGLLRSGKVELHQRSESGSCCHESRFPSCPRGESPTSSGQTVHV